MSERRLLDIAIALVFRGERLLVTRRRSGTHLEGYWEFPGGKIAAGETAEVCSVREVREETGVIVRAGRVRAPIIWEYPERVVKLHPVDCEWVSGEGELLAVSELRWVQTSELATLAFPPANAELVAELCRSC